ncbi:MAG: flagellar biosynthesis protein FlhF [Lachnospiraceae bacterium]|nr:flagellar biosynthesis protein FlhF [Lachnospiraceae bacterium]
MIIKKFTAKNENEAFALAVKELGDDVTIIHSKNVKPKGLFSFLRRMQVEITVAKEEEMDRPEALAKETIHKVNAAWARGENAARRDMDAELKTRPAEQKAEAEEKEEQPEKESEEAAVRRSAVLSAEAAVEEKLDNIQNLLEQKLKSRADEEKEKKEAAEEEKKEEDAGKKELTEFCRLLYHTLVENEVSERNANELVDDIEQNYSGGVQLEHVLSHIYQKIILKFGKPSRISPAEKGAKVVFFVGPTGVGKTTTLAKIASKFRLTENKRVVLFTTDTYRISATDQLKTYAGILGAPFQVIYSAEELVEQYTQYKDVDYILIDTAGHSHKNEEQKKEMADFLDALKDKAECENYLVLSATTKYKDLMAIAEAYRELCEYRLIFTKLDETKECGNLLNLRLHTGAAMSYVTNGQNVPDDIEVFNPQTMAKNLLTDQS